MKADFQFNAWAKIYGTMCLAGLGMALPANAQTASAPKADLIFVDEEAHPKNGLDAFYKHVRENLKYPEAALSAGVQGRVFVQFVVLANGSIEDIKVIRGIGSGCDEEAIRLVQSSPEWLPAKYHGKAIATEVSLPIRFSTTKE
ncbi:energy transducer TonB [Xanthocytophaga agilis]|uniref:Energy transducer TonB n=1 Tax=Xanthocytophaga agilis TaxID=3048010 RepID=A0AAE3R5L0_9BACT|nr:energy transducer TonB [Xanthocytophaga agilis]MDJ1501874.1 energy transducer TonB [Xanthocytophaga agilis]